MTTVYVMVGIPGSGKSTLARKLLEIGNEHRILSSDEIRDVFQLDKHSEVFAKMNGILESLVRDDTIETIFYDATNINRRRRRSLYRNIKNWNKDAHVEIIFNSVPLSTALERNTIRPEADRVPFEVVERMHKELQVPRTGVDCDSFNVSGIPIFNGDFDSKLKNTDSIEELVGSADMRWKYELMLSDTPHDCIPWHLESVFEHINMATFNSKSEDLKTIALLHDLGKGITKSKDDSGYATYRSHASVSAHYYLNMVSLSGATKIMTEKEQDIMEAIHQHMNFHNKLGIKNIGNNRLTNEVIRLGHEFSKVDSISKIKGDVEID